MLLLVLLVCCSPAALGQLGEPQTEDDLDLADFDFGIVRQGVYVFVIFGVCFLLFLFVCLFPARRRHVGSRVR